MSAAETIYSFRIAYPDYLERGRDQTVSLECYRDGALAAPASGTFTLYDTGETVLVTGAVVVASSIATYGLVAADLPATLSLGHGYREEWELVLADGVTKTIRRDAALVLHAAVPVLTDADLNAVYHDLTRHRLATDTSWQRYIDEAWKRILGRLEAAGVFPDHVVSYWSLREIHMEMTFHLIMLDFARAQGSRWLELAQHHKKEAEIAWSRLRFIKASGDDGVADSNDMQAASKVVYANRPPSKHWGGGFGL